MANATKIVGKAKVRRTDEFGPKASTETLAAQTVFYKGAMVGLDETGNYCKFDDTQSAIFAGLVRGDAGNPVLPAGTAGDPALALDIERPDFFELQIASVAVTDIGKTVYATDDQTGVLSGTKYANVVGIVRHVTGTNVGLVQPNYDGVKGYGAHAVRTLAATGDQALTKYDVNKLIAVPNTAAIAVTIPLVADLSLGDTFNFVRTDSAAKAVTVTCSGSDKIDGSATHASMDANFDTITIRAAAAATFAIVAQKIA